MRVAESFAKTCQLGMALGITNIKTLPGCWTHQVDERWWIALNGHDKDTLAASPDGMSTGVGFKVPPYSCYIEFNGWAWGIIGPDGGECMFGGAANENTFIEALDAAAAKAQASR